MKMKSIACSLIAVTMLAGQVASARPDSHRRGGPEGDYPSWQYQNGRHQGGPAYRPHAGPNKYHPGRGPHAYRPAAHFKPGGYLPPHYRGHGYWVNDWRGYGLRQPPRGHHWVRVGDDFVLIAVATGIITSILLSN
ncbi:hypothetical protein CUZ56_02690 [Saezia sanguinis]|uniref:Nickel/cobalt homeostasis protein RcnB n=2 Tax=Saezia sanguinis TaxID=1965230 RepID=A0A433SAB8_9BURK|nr:hypothetical protein CUZ56_02690 [Saezia sanguinis]